MARRRFLVAYDIRDPRRLRSICKLMEAHGDRMQYSVFVCDLDRTELVRLRAASEKLMDLAIDSVAIVDLGDVSDARFTFIGSRHRLPDRGDQIV
ncbi:MAG: CRISPR-associated endonuclease Cas2 [Nocardioides sp.]